jgi:hypothetical protein
MQTPQSKNKKPPLSPEGEIESILSGWVTPPSRKPHHQAGNTPNDSLTVFPVNQ